MSWYRYLILLFAVQASVNLIGVLGPELAFDALWYHLPIGRMLVERGEWGVIPGGLLYYSGLPRLGDWVFGWLLATSTWLGLDSPEILPKLLSYASGLFSSLMIYKIARKYATAEVSLLFALSWYSTLLVGWLSIAAYVDLVRTALLLISIYYMLSEKIVKSAIFAGLSYSVKILSGLDALFIAFFSSRLRTRIINPLLYLGILAVFVIFWGALNWLQGYDFFYPLFSYNLASGNIKMDMYTLAGAIATLLDPRARIGPVMLIVLALSYKQLLQTKVRELALMTAALYLSWYIFPRTDFGRFLLPTLALFSALGAASYHDLTQKKRIIIAVLILLQTVFGIVYRFGANFKFVPYILGQQTRQEFLSERLDFQYGDFVDIDGLITQNMEDMRYLVVGVHNTYYLPGKRWDHVSFADPEYCYPYILQQGSEEIPAQYLQDAKLVRENPDLGARIYQNQGCSVELEE